MSGYVKAMRVAIVDDNASVRGLLAELLAEHPHIEIVGQATDGDEALAMVTASDPELVIMDYSMARTDGLAATSLVAAAHPSVEIVAFTSTADPAVIAEFLARGASRQFDKADVDALTDYVAARARDGS